MKALTTIKVKNDGLLNIDWLIKMFEGKPATKENVTKLKDEIYDSFINNQFIDFSTGGSVSCTLWDDENGASCEFIYA